LQINNFQTSDGQKKRDVEIDAIAVENLSAVTGGASTPAEEAEPKLARVGAKSSAKPAGQAKEDDLDAIFASEDEIPF
jgi:single-stranded DNA-binding protein